MRRPHERLKVWQASVGLVTELYEVTGSFPSEERYGLTSQIRRAAVSVPANIAEGAARGSDGEYLRFARIARGSLSELETLLIIAHNLHFVGEERFESLSGKCESIGAMMEGLCRSLRKATVRDEEGSYEEA